MLGMISGILEHKELNNLLINVNGIGYEVIVLQETSAASLLNETIKLYTHFIIRDEACYLYGFLNLAERELFRELLKINGIGAKNALSILSKLSINDLINCVRSNDYASLKLVPGIGEKSAKRIIVELSSKIDVLVFIASTSSKDQNNNFIQHHVYGKLAEDSIEALASLGFNKRDSQLVIYDILSKSDGVQFDVQDLIKQALNLLTK